MCPSEPEQLSDKDRLKETRCLEVLTSHGIAFSLHRHPPVFTVEEAKALRGSLEGAHIKNLFLCDRKKRRFWLLVARESVPVNLKGLGKWLGCKLRFANADLLQTYLNVSPGSVTPLAVVHDEAEVVEVLWDLALSEFELINAHPLHNAATVTLSVKGLYELFAVTGHEPIAVDLDALLGA